MKTKILLYALFATLTLSACSNELKTSQVEIDMSRSELTDAMGDPDYIETDQSELLDDIESSVTFLVKVQTDSMTRHQSEFTSEEKMLFDMRSESLEELSEVLTALSSGKEVNRYDYLNEDIYFKGDDEVQNGDLKVYVSEGRVIHTNTVSND